MKLETAFPQLRSDAFGGRPLFVTEVPDGSGRLAVVAQEGVVYVAERNATQASVLLDISGRVSRAGNEEGLLGLAFHPDYAKNGRLFVYYSARPGERRTVLSEFRAINGRIEPAAEAILLQQPQPFSNHKGGALVFGPDGYLYLGLGDGGSGGDPLGNGQSLQTWLAKILRIDVNAGSPYGIPSDNPFAGSGAPAGAKPEIFAYGLRNPWRFTFDKATGALWVGDVGQNAREEIDMVVKGGNYGWSTMEGFSCYRPSNGCNRTGLSLPVLDYGHDQGCSITGGYVYRGGVIKWLQGAYLYSDFCEGTIWALRWDGSKVTEQKVLAESRLQVSSFGEDAAGELYVTAFDGRVYRIVDGG